MIIIDTNERLKIISVSIKKSEVYYEKTIGNKHCYKYQIPGQKIIIVTDIDKKEAWCKFINEYIRALRLTLNT